MRKPSKLLTKAQVDRGKAAFVSACGFCHGSNARGGESGPDLLRTGSSLKNAARFELPARGWTLHGGVVRPKSRGRIRLTGPNPTDPIQIEANFLSHPDDLKAAVACVELCREIGNSAPLRSYSKREAIPGNLKGAALENFVRDAAVTYWHETCTAKMGRDAMSVVDGALKVYGIDSFGLPMVRSCRESQRATPWRHAL